MTVFGQLLSELQLRETTIESLLAILEAVERCHGCVGCSKHWPEYEKQLDAAADLVKLAPEDRW